MEDTLEEWAILKHSLLVDKKKAVVDQAASATMRRILKIHSNLENISYIVSALLCIIVTTADCERGFSQLKLIKTPLRNSIGQINLNNAMQLCINSSADIEDFDFMAVKTKFCRKKKRRVM